MPDAVSRGWKRSIRGFPSVGQTARLTYDGRTVQPMHPTSSSSPEATRAWAAAWARTLPDGTVIALHGDLGAGKTCFVRGLADGLGITVPVHSPTFTLINEYRGPRTLFHLDLYRLGGPEEAWDIGIDQYLPGPGITAIEWAERITPLLPPNTLHVRLDYGSEINDRTIEITSSGSP